MIITINKSTTRNLIPLMAGVAGFLLLTTFVWNEHIPFASFSFLQSPVWSGFLATVLFLGLGYFFRKMYILTEFYNVEALLQNILVAGLVPLGMSIIPGLLRVTGAGWPLYGTWAYLYEALVFLLITAYLLNAVFLLKRLILVKKNRWTRRIWHWFLIYMILANIFNFSVINRPEWLVYGYAGAGGLLLLSLIVRQNWIALLNTKTKLFIILYLCIINLITFGLFQKMLDFELANFSNITLQKNLFLLGTFLFVGGYGLFSLLALLFNLPISSILENKNKELAGFREMTRSIETEYNRQEILRLLFRNCLENTRADGGWISMNFTETGEDKILEKERINGKDLKRVLFSYQYNQDHFKTSEQGYLYIYDFKTDPILSNHDLPFRSMVVFSLNINKHTTAKLFLLKKFHNGFDEYAIDLLKIYVTQTKLSINNANMLKEALETERMKKDLEIGRSLQKRLLPSEFPLNDKLEIIGTSISAEEVGGDYYDYHKISENKYAFIIADVSGKGTTAAFHVAEMKGIFQSLILSGISPVEFLEKANEAVGNCFDKGMFITLIYMVIDLEDRSLHYARAGHCPILHYSRDGKLVQYLEDEGLGLGIIRNGKYKDLISDNEFHFNSGDILLAYTDGVIEARNQMTGEEYGFDRLKEKLKINGGEGARKIMNDLLEDIELFAGENAEQDDISLLLFRAK